MPNKARAKKGSAGPGRKGEKAGKRGRPNGSRSKTGQGLPRNLRDIITALLVLASLLLAISIYGSWAGVLGGWINSFFAYLMGKLRYGLPPLLFLGGIAVLLGLLEEPREDRAPAFRFGWLEAVGISIFTIGLCAAFHLGNQAAEMFRSATLKAGGGLIGAGIAWPLVRLLSRVGAVIMVSGMIGVGFLMMTGLTISYGLQKRVETRRRRLQEKRDARAAARRKAQLETAKGPEGRGGAKGPEAEVAITGLPEPAVPAPEADAPADAASPAAPAERVFVPGGAAPRHGKESQLELLEAGEAAPAAGRKRYMLPPLSLLRRSDPSSSISKKSINESIAVVEKTLHDFNVDAAVTRVNRGPTVTRFEVELGSGVKVNQVLKLADDIAYAMASPDIRIIAPIPGKSAIGIEVPNRERDMVTLGDILCLKEVSSNRSPLRAALGKDVAGMPVVVNLMDMPHLLLAGSTGSGKSCCINTIVTSVLFSATPDQVRMIMIDPKFVELTHFNGIPHLLTPVITDPKKAAAALAWVVREMEQRYKLMARAGSKSIDAYNKEVDQGLGQEVDEEGRRLFPSLPYILVVIDELADLMMVAPAEVEESIARIAQMARAVGIHLVVATQRPSVDVVTGMIKANIPSRIAFTVASQTDSRVILDIAGAEKLVGRGDMLFLSAGSSKPMRVQGAYVSEKEIEPAVAFIKRQGKPHYDQEIMADVREEGQDALRADDLLDEAMEVVVKTGIASASFLQRKMRVGYARAARLIDLLEERGIVGGYEGSKPRAVLVTPEELQAIREKKEEE
jgi:S-DNA-T family DNA segregation ATPase FtsK/SpoIIIE